MRFDQWKLGWRGRTRGAAALAVLAIVIAGCGGATAGGKSGAKTSATTSMTIVYPSANAGYDDLYMQLMEGFAKEHHLNLTLKLIDSSANLLPSVASGSAQIAGGAAVNIAEGIMKGVPLVFLALTEPKINGEVWASAKVASTASLKGTTMAVDLPGSLGALAASAFLKEHHLTSSQVTIKYTGSVPGNITALKSGAVDETIITPPNQALLGPGFHMIENLSHISFPAVGYVTTESYLRSHKSAIEQFLSGETQALGFLRSHEQAAVAGIEKYTLTKSQAAAEGAYKFFLGVWPSTATAPIGLVKQAFALASGILGKPAPSNVQKYVFG